MVCELCSHVWKHAHEAECRVKQLLPQLHRNGICALMSLGKKIQRAGTFIFIEFFCINLFKHLWNICLVKTKCWFKAHSCGNHAAIWRSFLAHRLCQPPPPPESWPCCFLAEHHGRDSPLPAQEAILRMLPQSRVPFSSVTAFSLFLQANAV